MCSCRYASRLRPETEADCEADMLKRRWWWLCCGGSPVVLLLPVLMWPRSVIVVTLLPLVLGVAQL